MINTLSNASVTPELDEIIKGVVVASDKIDDLRDLQKAGTKLGFAQVLPILIAVQSDVVAAVQGSDKALAELQNITREGAGALGEKIGLAVYDIYADLKDPNA